MARRQNAKKPKTNSKTKPNTKPNAKPDLKAEVEKRVSVNHFDKLPDELIVEIFGHLKSDQRSLINFASTCHRMIKLMQSLPKWPNGLYFAIDHDIWDICYNCLDGLTRGPLVKPSSTHRNYDELLNKKWFKCNYLGLHEAELTMECMDRAFNDALRSSAPGVKQLALENIENLVELSTSFDHLEFLCRVMNHLTGVKYLTVNSGACSVDLPYMTFSRNIEVLTLYNTKSLTLGRNSILDLIRPRILKVVYTLVKIKKERQEIVKDFLKSRFGICSMAEFLMENHNYCRDFEPDAGKVSASELELLRQETDDIKAKFNGTKLTSCAHEDYPAEYYFSLDIINLPMDKKMRQELLIAVHNLGRKQRGIYKSRCDSTSQRRL